MSRILIAGIGNIFLGDDAFGVEVVRRLRDLPLPGDVSVHDFGIRCLELAYCLLDEWDAAILIDTAARGNPPGTVVTIDLDTEDDDAHDTQAGALPPLDPHTVGVHQMRQLARRLAEQVPGRLPRMFLVGAEPFRFKTPDHDTGLSPPLMAAVEPAITAVMERLAALREEMMIGSL